ncbi:MAG TPA: TIR domain-containing protein [Pyrinomonadaceae bacterium]
MADESAESTVPPGLKLRHRLRGHRGRITRLAWSPDGRTLASSSTDRTVKLWDAETGQLRRTYAGHIYPAVQVAWSPDGELVASVSHTKVSSGGLYYLRVWRADTGHDQPLLGGYSLNAPSLAWSPNGWALAISSEEFVRICEFRARDGVMTCKVRVEDKRGSSCLAWSPDGQILAASASDTNAIRLWNPDAPTRYREMRGHADRVLGMAWSPDGRTLASASADKTIRLWDSVTGQQTSIFEGHTNSIVNISFSPDGSLLASKTLDEDVVRLWRRDSWEMAAAIGERVAADSPGLAFSPAAPLLATLGESAEDICIWGLDVSALVAPSPGEELFHYMTAKIVLVGDNGVGKTGLGWRLSHGEFKEHPSSHGQQFWVIDALGTVRHDGTVCEAVLWDLAGQPDYRLIHVLFLDDVKLALVLFDPTDRVEPLKGARYWLKQLTQKGRRCPAILVGARADMGAPTLRHEELETFCREYGASCGYISTSALTGQGLPELTERVKAAIDWGAMAPTVTTATFKRVKQFVLGLREVPRQGGVLFSPGELRARLEATDADWKFTDAEMMTAVRHLSTHGYVSVLRGSQGEEIILLAPDLLANLASSLVLEARRNPKGLGAVDEERVLRGEYVFPELKHLAARERAVLLDAAVALFLEHSLCFRESLGTQTLLVFPALINQKRPLLEEVEKVYGYSYRVSGAVENVYAALVVQLGYTHTFTRTNQWQNQAEYETAKGDICGFRQVDEREGEIELVLYYAKDKRGARFLFHRLFEEFLRGRDVTVKKFPPVECPRCKYQQDRAGVVKRFREGEDFLYCINCGARITLPKEGEEDDAPAIEPIRLGEEQDRARRRKDYETALVRIKAIVRDEKNAGPSCFISYARGEAPHERWVQPWVRDLAHDLQNAGVEVFLDQKDTPIGTNIVDYINLIASNDMNFIIPVGTPAYLRKFERENSTLANYVRAEIDLISQRLLRRDGTVLPLLLEGDEQTSFPPLMRSDVYADFRQAASYFVELYNLILRLYGIPFDHPAVSDLRDSLHPGAERF